MRVQIDTLVNPIVPKPPDLVGKIPLFDRLSTESIRMLTDWLNDPVSLLTGAGILMLLMIYLVVDLAQNWHPVAPGGKTALYDSDKDRDTANCPNGFYYTKLALLLGIIFISVFLSTFSVAYLRHVSDPSSFAHDGGILMNEQAMKWLLEGKNVYLESFAGTPMEVNFANEPSITHFPYLPWVFEFPLPFYVAGNAIFGWFDMRFVYLLLLGIMVLLAPGMAKNRVEKLTLVALLGLNPIMSNDIIYGQNDVFILFWMVLSIYFFTKRKEHLASMAMGLAIASKFTAWFFLPFLLLYLCQVPITSPIRFALAAARKSLVMATTAVLAVLPFALWNFGGMFEDVWSFNVGASQSPVLIKGIGFANAVLALGWVNDKSSPFPFWIPELLFCLPLLIFLLLWQQKDNTLRRALIAFSVFFLTVIYFSRTMNPNYIGFALSFFALGFLLREDTRQTELYKPEDDAVSYANTSVGRT